MGHHHSHGHQHSLSPKKIAKKAGIVALSTLCTGGLAGLYWLYKLGHELGHHFWKAIASLHNHTVGKGYAGFLSKYSKAIRFVLATTGVIIIVGSFVASGGVVAGVVVPVLTVFAVLNAVPVVAGWASLHVKMLQYSDHTTDFETINRDMSIALGHVPEVPGTTTAERVVFATRQASSVNGIAGSAIGLAASGAAIGIDFAVPGANAIITGASGAFQIAARSSAFASILASFGISLNRIRVAKNVDLEEQRRFRSYSERLHPIYALNARYIVEMYFKPYVSKSDDFYVETLKSHLYRALFTSQYEYHTLLPYQETLQAVQELLPLNRYLKQTRTWWKLWEKPHYTLNKEAFLSLDQDQHRYTEAPDHRFQRKSATLDAMQTMEYLLKDKLFKPSPTVVSVADSFVNTYIAASEKETENVKLLHRAITSSLSKEGDKLAQYSKADLKEHCLHTLIPLLTETKAEDPHSRSSLPPYRINEKALEALTHDTNPSLADKHDASFARHYAFRLVEKRLDDNWRYTTSSPAEKKMPASAHLSMTVESCLNTLVLVPHKAATEHLRTQLYLHLQQWEKRYDRLTETALHSIEQKVIQAFTPYLTSHTKRFWKLIPYGTTRQQLDLKKLSQNPAFQAYLEEWNTAAEAITSMFVNSNLIDMSKHHEALHRLAVHYLQCEMRRTAIDSPKVSVKQALAHFTKALNALPTHKNGIVRTSALKTLVAKSIYAKTLFQPGEKNSKDPGYQNAALSFFTRSVIEECLASLTPTLPAAATAKAHQELVSTLQKEHVTSTKEETDALLVDASLETLRKKQHTPTREATSLFLTELWKNKNTVPVLDPSTVTLALHHQQQHTKQRMRTHKNIHNNLMPKGTSIGAVIEDLVVIDVIPGSPAEKAGLHKGDKIVKVDGVRLEHEKTDTIRKLIRGEEIGETSVFTIETERGETRTASITRGCNDFKHRCTYSATKRMHVQREAKSRTIKCASLKNIPAVSEWLQAEDQSLLSPDAKIARRTAKEVTEKGVSDNQFVSAFMQRYSEQSAVLLR